MLSKSDIPSFCACIKLTITTSALKLFTSLSSVMPIHTLYCLSAVWGGAAAYHLYRAEGGQFQRAGCVGVYRDNHVSPVLASLGLRSAHELVARCERVDRIDCYARQENTMLEK